ncbi:Meiotic recombination protein rec8 [Neofusicoccum parvum]|uniref:Meiotic recombination protein rec8 n=1 Tax=Neofusicoccum parvum TaxID=310453 RepID=A0ACB5RUA6_9PEZI|nr:Meiotic recombination protein rec8 [Neofusicoccum parvum]
MFYSHEVLTNRKYGVATVWLVATLGSKSATTKKVTRKAILNVNVPKACDTIIEPEVPLALRLQGSLLYGVSKVYSQQCSYVLADAQSMQNHVRTALMQITRDTELDPEAGRARPDQLVLEDDPSFLPDFALAPLELDDASDLDLPTLTRSSSLSSPRRSRSPRQEITLEEQDGGPVFGIQVPSSDGHSFGDIGGFVVPGDDGPDFGFDAEGNLIEHVSSSHLQKTPATVPRPGLPSSSAASARYGDLMDANMPIEDDEVDLLPEAEALPSTRDRPSSPSGRSLAEEEIMESSSVVQAPMRSKAKRRVIPMDRTMELRNTDLANWMNDYVDNMREAGKNKQALRAFHQAKKNAEYWVLGLGIGGIGAIVNGTGLIGPLDMFRGDALLLSLGIDRNAAKKKRGHQAIDQDEKSNDDERRVRRRSEEDEVGRGDVDMEDGGVVNAEEEDVEVPREAEQEMDARDHSQLFPWNVTASVRNSSLAPSARRALGFGGSGISSSAGGASGMVGSLGRRSRMVSESPLHGRGPPGNLAPLPSSEANDYGNDTLGGIGGDISVGGDDDFELYGAAAGVDTQTANDSQFAQTAFAKEMENFGMFIFDSLREKEEAAAADGIEPAGINEILFEDALPPETTMRIVAAQGFMHLLALATHGRVSARQNEPFAEIGMSLPHAHEVEPVV